MTLWTSSKIFYRKKFPKKHQKNLNTFSETNALTLHFAIKNYTRRLFIIIIRYMKRRKYIKIKILRLYCIFFSSRPMVRLILPSITFAYYIIFYYLPGFGLVFNCPPVMVVDKNLSIFIFLSIILTKIFAQTVEVNTSRGRVLGFRVDYGNDTNALYYGSADVFLGIPFVQPPVGQLRFQVIKILKNFKNIL